MATYCIADIHGRYDELMRLLDRVGPSSDDEIYVLGDIVDKGPQVNEVLEWAIERPPKGFHFLIGNHEDMLASYLAFSHDGHPWYINNDAETKTQTLLGGHLPWYHTVVHPWIDSLPLHADIDVNGERHILMHSGVRMPGVDAPSLKIEELGARTEAVTIDGLPDQSAQEMMWMREGWIDRIHDDGITFICGHNALGFFDADSFVDDLLAAAGSSTRMRPGYVDHIGSRYFIDAGTFLMGQRPEADLAMLRLDDKVAFYLNKENEQV